jgi:hypothetical protein
VANLFIGGRYFSRRARALVHLVMSWPATTARAHPNLAGECHGTTQIIRIKVQKTIAKAIKFRN